MALRARIEPLDRDIAVILSQDLSSEAQSRALANFARRELQDAQNVNRQALGHVPPHDTFVDGRASEALETVKPSGAIVFEFELLEDVFSWIAAALEKHSPKRSGRYSKSHAFYADNAEADPANPPAASEYVFVSLQPYARKIERGLSRQAPDGVYQAVATLANGRFGNIAKVRFTYRTPLGGAINSWAQSTSLVRKGRRMTERARGEWLRRQPAILITVR